MISFKLSGRPGGDRRSNSLQRRSMELQDRQARRSVRKEDTVMNTAETGKAPSAPIPGPRRSKALEAPLLQKLMK